MTFAACCAENLAGRDAPIERFVAPVRGGELLQRLGSQGVGDELRVERCSSEDVVPMRVGEHDGARRRDAFSLEAVEEEPCVRVG